MNRLVLTGFSTLLLSAALAPFAKANETVGQTNYPNSTTPDIEVFDQYWPDQDVANPPGTAIGVYSADSERNQSEYNSGSMEEDINSPGADNAPGFEGVPEIEATDDMEADPSGEGIGLEPEEDSQYDGYSNESDDSYMQEDNSSPGATNEPAFEEVPEIEATDDMEANPSGEGIGLEPEEGSQSDDMYMQEEDNSSPGATNEPAFENEGVPEIEATDDMEANPSGEGIGQ
ncbi:MAG: hypothetical protein Kow00121_35110 [Elainellaceae cyanobacterium]